MTSENFETYGEVPLSEIEAAIKTMREHYPDKDSNDINVTFEYLIGSFFPEIINNIKEMVQLYYARGYADALMNHNLELDNTYEVKIPQ